MILPVRIKKSISILMLIVILSNLLLPSYSWALTAGPTAPEATSFEPVDTTDMVNTITGDFTYNLPLLEVPGPGGSYPITMSYHAGIQPGVDASWVGLGWSLNPGAINRITNGLPDDLKETVSTDRQFWEGGETTVTSVGVSVGLGNVASVSAGLEFATDTYKGRGIGGYLGGSLSFQDGKQGISARVGISPYGGSYLSSNANVGIGASSAFANYDSRFGFNSGLSSGVGVGPVSVGVSYDTQEGFNTRGGFGIPRLLNATISTNNSKGSLSVGGFSYAYGSNNSKNGNISMASDSWSLNIPVFYLINLSIGRQYTRYWMDETETLKNYGSIFFPSTDVGDMSTKVFDSYHMANLNSMAYGEHPAKSMEGSYADYDSYSVNAQGVGGSMRPHHYNVSLYSQDVVNSANEVTTKNVLGYFIPQASQKVMFRFDNDFSNRVINQPNTITINHNYTTPTNPTPSDPNFQDWVNQADSIEQVNYATTTTPLYFQYSSPITGKPGSPQYIPKVASSRHIEFFTNDEIVEAQKVNAQGQLINSAAWSQIHARGFMDCSAKGFTRTNSGGKIGAFTITNESGVSYNFSLPAYSYEEYTYSENKADQAGSRSFNNTSQSDRYAYTWFLTGVTGPDYIDRGPEGDPDGILNEFDWGYWVDFNYGMWTDEYIWRNPGEGFNTDLDNEFKSVSKGKKEIYYLNRIKTSTHTALFVKEIRADGKGVEAARHAPVTTYAQNINWTDEGGHLPIFKTFEEVEEIFVDTHVTFSIQGNAYPRAVMALKSIILFNNDDVESLTEISNLGAYYKQQFTYYPQSSNQAYAGLNPLSPKTIIPHHGENVIDVSDITHVSFPSNQAIRKIDFNHDYSLSPSTPNSYDAEGAMYSGGTYNTDLLGKLTLKAVTFRGHGGAGSIPPISFEYELNDSPPTYNTITNVDTAGKTLTVSNSDDITIGDIVSFNQSDSQYCGYVKTVQSGIKTIEIISDQLPVLGAISEFRLTKNPPYKKDFTDIWGYFKVDRHQVPYRNLEKYPSYISTKNSDVWSLRKIKTSTGANIHINYESDDFSQSIITKNLTIKLLSSTNTENVTPIIESYENTNWTKYFLEATLDAGASIDFDSLYNVGDAVDMVTIFHGDRYVNQGYPPDNTPYIVPIGVVQQVGSKYIRIRVYTPFVNNSASFQGGFMQVTNQSHYLGGGLRVRSLEVTDPLSGDSRFTQYEYKVDGLSTGVTSYEPINISDIKLPSSANPTYAAVAKELFFAPFIKILTMARDVPAPGVYYKKVRVKEGIKRANGEVTMIPGYSEYQFQTFSDDMIGVTSGALVSQNSTGTHRGESYNMIQAKRVYLRNFTQRLGNLISVTSYNESGQKMSETKNHYLHDEQTGNLSYFTNEAQYPALVNTRYGDQGVVHETFHHARWVRMSDTDKRLLGITSQKENYPNIQTGTTTINYKTGIKTEAKSLGYDFYSGAIRKSLVIDGLGNTLITENIPAYEKYPAMGSKMTDVANKNMLSQQAATNTFKVNPLNMEERLALVSASAQTWSNQLPVLGIGANGANGVQGSIWRQKSSFTFIGSDGVALRPDGLMPISEFTEFNDWLGDTEPAKWERLSKVELVDTYSHALEATDINGNYAATKMSLDQTRVFTTAANSRYSEFAYTGLEETAAADGTLGGGVKFVGQSVSSTAHTGTRSASANTGQKGFSYTFTNSTANKKFHVAVWANQSSGVLRYSVNGVTQTNPTKTVNQAGTWYLIEADITMPTGTIVVWCESVGTTTLFDDFRIHPLSASMVSYVYNSWGELTHILDNNNLYTEYEYDGMGRLTKVYRESFQHGRTKTKETQYHYANQ